MHALVYALVVSTVIVIAVTGLELLGPRGLRRVKIVGEAAVVLSGVTLGMVLAWQQSWVSGLASTLLVGGATVLGWRDGAVQNAMHTIAVQWQGMQRPK